MILCLFFNFFDTKYIAAAPPYLATSLSDKLKFPASKRMYKRLENSYCQIRLKELTLRSVDVLIMNIMCRIPVLSKGAVASRY